MKIMQRGKFYVLYDRSGRLLLSAAIKGFARII
jgi:hypothetical protein